MTRQTKAKAKPRPTQQRSGQKMVSATVGRFVRRMGRYIRSCASKCIPEGQKPIMIWGIFEVVLSLVFAIVFIRFAFSRSMFLGLPQWCMVFFCLIRICSGAVGSVAAHRRGRRLMRRYLFLVLLNGLLIIWQLRCIWGTTCMCNDKFQCEALQSFSPGRKMINLFELFEDKKYEAEMPGDSTTFEDTGEREVFVNFDGLEDESQAAIRSLLESESPQNRSLTIESWSSPKTSSPENLTLVLTNMASRVQHLPRLNRVKSEAPLLESGTDENKTKAIASSAVAVDPTPKGSQWRRLQPPPAETTNLLTDKSPRPLFAKVSRNIHFESVNLNGDKEGHAHALSAGCLSIKIPTTEAQVENCHQDPTGSRCPAWLSTSLWNCHFEPKCGAVTFTGIKPFTRTSNDTHAEGAGYSKDLNISWFTCRLRHHLIPKLHQLDPDEEYMTDQYTFQKKLFTGNSPSLQYFGMEMSDAELNKLKRDLVEQNLGMMSEENKVSLNDTRLGKFSLHKAWEESCTCAPPGCQINQKDDGWCYIDDSRDKKEACMRDRLWLLKDKDGKEWTKELCTKKDYMISPLHAIPKSTALARCTDLCNPIGLPPVKSSTYTKKLMEKMESEFQYGSGECKRWNENDPYKWCYVGFHTACDDREKHSWPRLGACIQGQKCSKIPTGQVVMWKSSIGCLLRDREEDDLRRRASETCKLVKNMILVFLTMHLVLLPIAFMSVTKFLKKACGEQQNRQSFWVPFEKGSDESESEVDFEEFADRSSMSSDFLSDHTRPSAREIEINNYNYNREPEL